MPPRRTKKSQSSKSKKGKKEKDNAVEERKEHLLSDFRQQVQKHIGYMSREADRMCVAIRNIYHTEIILLPKKVREMTIKEYCEQGGGINGLCVKNVKEEISTAVSKNVSSVLSKVQMNQNQENSENSGNTTRSTRVLRPRKVKTTTVRTRTTRSTTKVLKAVNCNVENTPYNLQSLMKTPMITPKFDPSLPTPAILRKPRFGEFVVSMAGSPLQNASDLETGPGVLVSLGGGKVISITDRTALDKDDIEKLDETAKNSLLAVKEKLNKLLQVPD